MTQIFFFIIKLIINIIFFQGDLKKFLLATRTEEEILRQKEKADDADGVTKKSGNTIPLLIPQILALAHQISKGMECISDNRMIHRLEFFFQTI